MDTTQLLVRTAKWAGIIGVSLLSSGCGDSSTDGVAKDYSLRSVLTSEPDTPVYNPAGRFAVVINAPLGTPHLLTGEHDAFGNQITIACSTCHTSREPNPTNARTSDLDEFHQGLAFTHSNGQVTCLSCHNADDYDTLRLANGTALSYSDAMTLCSQCHGPQYRDYQNGAHGGMNGYWDLSQGPRVRNNCVDCHDPHAPAFPHMEPTFKPVDRFLDAMHDDEHEQSSGGLNDRVKSNENHGGLTDG